MEFSQVNSSFADSLTVANLPLFLFAFLFQLFFSSFSIQAFLFKWPKALCTLSFPVAGPLQRPGWVTAVQVWGTRFIQVGHQSITYWLLFHLVIWSLGHLVTSGQLVSKAVSKPHPLVSLSLLPNWSFGHLDTLSIKACWVVTQSPQSITSPHLVSWSRGRLVTWWFGHLVNKSHLVTLNSSPGHGRRFRGPQSEYRQQFVPCTATRFCTIN